MVLNNRYVAFRKTKLVLSHIRHKETICAEAFRNLEFIKRNCTDTSYKCLKAMYFALVRPVLKFGSLIWNPRHSGLIDKIEKIQRNVIRMIAFKLNLHGQPISHVENQYEISPLANRRDYKDCLFSCKLLYGTVNCSELLNLAGFKVLSVNTKNKTLFHIAQSKRNFVIHNLINRISYYSNDHLPNLDFFF